MWDIEALKNNVLQDLSKILINLQEAESILSGIDTSGLSIDLQIGSIISIIKGSKDKVESAAISCINALVDDLNQSESESIKAINELFGDANDTDVSKAETANRLYQLWKANIQYNYSYGVAGSYRYYMIEPEDADPNIPTLFCFDGAGLSHLAGYSETGMEELITGNTQNHYDQLFSPLAAITQGGLDYPNMRIIYIPNPSESTLACGMSTNAFDRMLETILAENPQIDTSNMSIAGHSAGGKTAVQIAAESKYMFKNGIMVSSCWSQEDKISDWMGQAIKRGTKFYGSYSKNDTDKNPNTGKIYRTKGFTEEHLAEYNQREPWYFSDSDKPHAQTYWDFFTYDGDQDGKADTLETIFG